MDWRFGLTIYLYLLLSVIIIHKSPLYLQRPVAVILFCVAIIINTYSFVPTPGLEWFVPFYYLKLLICHGLTEEPYRPESENETTPENADNKEKEKEEA